MMAEKKKPKEDKTLVDRVRDEVKEGNLDSSQARRHYIPIAEQLVNYDSDLKKHTKLLERAVTLDHNTPDELYLAIMKHIAVDKKVLSEGAAKKIKSLEDFSKEEIDEIRNHLNITYGISDENQLRSILDSVSGDKYSDDEEVRAALRGLANQKVGYELQTRARAWTNEKDWPAHTGEGGSHHKFMKLIAKAHYPEGGVPDVGTYKRPEQAVSYLAEAGREAVEARAKKRRKL